MTRFLITGHAGFIGFHTARRLLDDGHDVVGIDSVNAYYDPQLKRDRLNELSDRPKLVSHEFSIEDAGRLKETFEEHRPEIVVHLAAQAGVRYSIEQPESYVRANLVGTCNVLEAARWNPVRHLMLASSSSVYGMNTKVPFSETDKADNPVSLYAATKKATEALSHSYAHLYGIPTTAFRFFTVYGPWGRPDMALFKFVRAIEQGEPIDVYGGGEMRRDFTYIDDLVAAILRLSDIVPQAGESVGEFDTLSPVAPHRVVNLGGGTPVGLLDFIGAVESAVGKNAKRNILPMQPGDVVQTSADPSLLTALTGEAPPATAVEDGVRAFVEWWRAYQARATQP